jgi:hypothetical protein
MEDGYGQIMAGIGIRMNHSDILFIIMEDGTMMTITVGFGSPIINGHQPGLSGVTMISTSAGLRFHPMLFLESLVE